MNFRADSKVLIQGITQPFGATGAALMKAYGTNVVAGVSPGFGGQTLDEIPVFDMVEGALQAVGKVDATAIFVPPYSVLDAALEAIASGIRLVLIVTEGVPPLDMVSLVKKAEETGTWVIGPSSLGIIVPGKILLGTYPAEFYTPGKVGLIGRSGSLICEIARQLTRAGLGQSLCVCVGGDAIVGSSFVEWLQILNKDESTEAIVLIGEIGGTCEEAAARYIAEAIDKPAIAYVAGQYAPKGKRLGHAGAIITAQLADLGADVGTAESKIAAFKEAKVPVAYRPSQIPDLVKKALKKSGHKAKK
ncbi:MAG: CoA-binding protein [Oscillatoria princeps RMCB-10]|nr:CoA-binding protein [Oscillatoria princeps RMCB-10]